MNKVRAALRVIQSRDVEASVSQSVSIYSHYFVSIVLGLIIAGMDLFAKQWSKPLVLSVLLMPFHPWPGKRMRGRPGPMARRIPMPHPGVILKEEFLEPLGMPVYALTKEIRVPRSRINVICLGKHGIAANIALRLGKFFNADPQWFTNIRRSMISTQRERVEELAAAT
jgi:antitoxin HigA-1